MYELRLLVDEADVEETGDLLMDSLAALSVSVEDADADTQDERALFGEPGMPVDRAGWQRSTLRALFDSEAEATDAATWLLSRNEERDRDENGARQPGQDGLHISLVSIDRVEDQDWVRLTQSQFDPVEITPTFWIVPTWHEPPTAADKVIRLDPGLAFGTGTHPTTRMCLRWIANQPHAETGWSRVLDYGCGSGILAIGAALFGATSIDAVDIDPAAVESTRLNADQNHVTLHADLPDAADGLYPLVLANILATPLKLLAPLLCAHVAPGGSLVLAGILERQADELIEAYAPWVRLAVSDCIDGWILMTGRRETSDVAARSPKDFG